MKGGVILFRGSGADARRYLESDRSRADEYYLEGGSALAEFAVVDGEGVPIGQGALAADEYALWVDWINPLTGESMGRPRLSGEGRLGSPRFAEMVVNTPKSLSIAAALHPEVSVALDAAQRDAMGEIRHWLGQHAVTRVGPRGMQEVVPIEQLETVSVIHKTSRAGDPHRHIHFQIGTRVWAAGKWRGLDTAALFKQQGAIRALGTAVIAAHPQLAQVLDTHGLSLDPVTGEVAELQPYNPVMSKRGVQVARNLARFEARWRAAHPGQEPGPVVMSRLIAMAWDHERPAKKPSKLGHEDAWRAELEEAGYRADPARVPVQPAASLDDLRPQQVASRALDRCAADASTWTVHDIQEHVTQIITESGARAEPAAVHKLIAITTKLAAGGCLSVLPVGTTRPEHVAHLTSLHVVAVETQLRDMLTARATVGGAQPVLDVNDLADHHDLDTEQARAAAAIASAARLVVVEGAAGAGKTTMLGAAIEVAATQGRATRVVTPTKKAADVAHQELGVATDSVAKLVHEHGWRWNHDGVWTRLTPGDTDPHTGATYLGPSKGSRLLPGERIVVDEAGMLDQDTALALLTVADEHGATLALVGDRAQLAAVGRGGVLDMAADLTPDVFDMTTVHRFTDPLYAELTVQLRAGEHPALLFNRLHALGLVILHPTTEDTLEVIARDRHDGDAITVATNDAARELNARIRQTRVQHGIVDDTRTTTGSDDLPIGAGDVIQTRHNNSDLGVTNRQTWTVQSVDADGTVWATENARERKHQRTACLPAAYVAEHTHLAYASTAYGVQGATVPESHTVLTEVLDASGVYVGMTRARDTNRLHVVATDVDDAREQFVLALARDRADRGLAAGTQTARKAVAGLATDGAVKVVNTERARLTKLIEYADRQANRWEHAAAKLDHQHREHQAEADKLRASLASAEATAQQVHAEITGPLIEQATTDGTAYLLARDRMWAASAAHRTARGLRKPSAARTLTAAAEEHHTAETATRQRWDSLPQTPAGIEPWAAAVAQREADADPRAIQSRRQADQARQAQQHLAHRQMQDHTDLRRQLFGNHQPRNAQTSASRWRGQAESLRHDLASIESLPVDQAAQLVHAQQEQAQLNAAETAAHRAPASQIHGHGSAPSDHELEL